MSDYAGDDTFHTTVTVLDDSDDPSAANFALSVEGLTDRTTWLRNRGTYVAAVESYGTSGVAADQVSGPTDDPGNWQDFPTLAGVVPFVDVTGCVVGDKIEVFCRADMSSTGALNVGSVRLAAVQNQGGGGSTVAINGTEVVSVWDYATFAFPHPSTMAGLVTISTAGTCRIKLQGKNSDTGKVGVLGLHTYYLRAVRHRPTV